jgi:ketosteroid isomerase-like protein
MNEEQLFEFTNDWDRAIEENDVDKIRSFMTDDWVCVATNGGITDIDSFLGEIQHGHLVHTEMSTIESRVKVYHNTGIVTGKGYSKGTYKGKEFSFYEWSTSVFVYTGSKWSCVHTMLTEAKD